MVTLLYSCTTLRAARRNKVIYLFEWTTFHIKSNWLSPWLNLCCYIYKSFREVISISTLKSLDTPSLPSVDALPNAYSIYGSTSICVKNKHRPTYVCVEGLPHLVGASIVYLVGNAVCLLRGPNSCGRDLEAHLAALGKEYVGGLLCVGLELSLHGLDVVVGLCLKLG